MADEAKEDGASAMELSGGGGGGAEAAAASFTSASAASSSSAAAAAAAAAPLPASAGAADPVYRAGALFSRLSNASDQLDVERYRELVAQWRPDDALLAADTTFASYDADKDGFLTLDDFLRLVHTVLPASSARAGAAAGGWAGNSSANGGGALEPAARAPYMYTPGLFPFYEARAEVRAWKAHAELLESRYNASIMAGGGGGGAGGGGPPSPAKAGGRGAAVAADEKKEGGGGDDERETVTATYTRKKGGGDGVKWSTGGEETVTVKYKEQSEPQSIEDWEALGRAYGATGTAASAIAFGGARGVRWFDQSMGVWLWKGAPIQEEGCDDDDKYQKAVGEERIYRWQESTKEWLPLTRKHAAALQEHQERKLRYSFGYGGHGGRRRAMNTTTGVPPELGQPGDHLVFDARHPYLEGSGAAAAAGRFRAHPAYRPGGGLAWPPYGRDAALQHGAPWPPHARDMPLDGGGGASLSGVGGGALGRRTTERLTRSGMAYSGGGGGAVAGEGDGYGRWKYAPNGRPSPYPEPVAIDALRGPLYAPEQLAAYQDARYGEALRVEALRRSMRHLPRDQYFDDGFARHAAYRNRNRNGRKGTGRTGGGDHGYGSQKNGAADGFANADGGLGLLMADEYGTRLQRSRHYWAGLNDSQWRPVQWKYDRAASRRAAAEAEAAAAAAGGGGGSGGVSAEPVWGHSSYSMEPDGRVRQTKDFEWVGRPVSLERTFPDPTAVEAAAAAGGGGGGGDAGSAAENADAGAGGEE